MTALGMENLASRFLFAIASSSLQSGDFESGDFESGGLSGFVMSLNTFVFFIFIEQHTVHRMPPMVLSQTNAQKEVSAILVHLLQYLTIYFPSLGFRSRQFLCC